MAELQPNLRLNMVEEMRRSEPIIDRALKIHQYVKDHGEQSSELPGKRSLAAGNILAVTYEDAKPFNVLVFILKFPHGDVHPRANMTDPQDPTSVYFSLEITYHSEIGIPVRDNESPKVESEVEFHTTLFSESLNMGEQDPSIRVNPNRGENKETIFFQGDPRKFTGNLDIQLLKFSQEALDLLTDPNQHYNYPDLE